MNGFNNEPEIYKLQQIEACERVIRSGWYILGNEVSSFEKEWAQTCGSTYAVGVANGMDAIEISLKASFDIKPCDEIITTPMTAFATVLAIIRAGAIPVLADIDPNTGNLCIESVNRCITKKTKAIVLVHLYGRISNMDEWLNLAERNKIFLIEDCAQAHLSEWNNKKAGTFGIAGAFSFYPTKNLGAIGDAGAIITSSQEIYEKALKYRNYGQSKRYYHTEIGLNSRLDEIQAAILKVRLNYLQKFTEQRKMIANEYNTTINNDKIIKMSIAPYLEHVYHLYVIKTKERKKLQEYLSNLKIESFIHYPVPIHKQELGLNFMQDSAGLRNTEIHAETCLSIPCHPQMTNDEVQYIIKCINNF
jgi:dTDP-4-amino-4,6-dideoxygalactose transaminase